MADVTVKVLTPATSFAFMTLEEAKLALNITDANSDAQLRWQIDVNSATIAELCNRVFAKERVRETWRCLQPPRLFLTHWPVKEEDIESVTCGGTALVSAADYELEEASGKILLFGSKTEPVIITYTGGFVLPDDAPMPLKQATGLLVGVSRTVQQQEAMSGIRMIVHKEKRIQFQSPQQAGAGSSSASTGSGARAAVNSLLSHYTRLWV